MGQYKEALDDYDIALKLDSEKSKIKKTRIFTSSRRNNLERTFSNKDN